MKIAIVGVTGLVGRKILQILEERNFKNIDIIPVASKKNTGKTIVFNNKKYTIQDIETAINETPEIAIFSAGSNLSLQYAPEFEKQGCFVIDNSSAWRMDKSKKLIVPEINAHTLTKNDKIIANPNCSTIQLVMVLSPLHKKYKIKRVIISTYQSITGTGKKAVEQLENERNNINSEKIYPYQIDKNCLPHCDIFLENDYTKEEMKLVNETRKILNDDSIMISATAVRVPVTGGHSESVNVEFETNYNINELKKTLSETEGLVIQDDISRNIYPMPITANDKDEVFVGRIRKDISNDKAVNMWIVADNLRKGAATNAVQIAEYVKNNFLS
jgi:aspartate-semialdehyde dehydrogenase